MTDASRRERDPAGGGYGGLPKSPCGFSAMEGLTKPPRFAAHLGVRAPDRPLFRELAGSTDVQTQLAFVARQGFAGISDNFLLLRSPGEQTAIGRYAQELGLEFGSFVHDPLRWNHPIWTQTGRTGRATLRAALAESLAAAGRVEARTVSCVTGRDADRAFALQLRAMADNLAWAAEHAARAGVTLCIETTHPSFAPGALIERFDDALQILRHVDHAAVRLNLDIGHLALHGEDILPAIALSRGSIGMVQLADVPGRVEPGAGTLDWPPIFEALRECGYSGLLELELEPLEEGAAGERALLQRLSAFSSPALRR